MSLKMGIMRRIWLMEKTGLSSLRCLRWWSPVWMFSHKQRTTYSRGNTHAYLESRAVPGLMSACWFCCDHLVHTREGVGSVSA